MGFPAQGDRGAVGFHGFTVRRIRSASPCGGALVNYAHGRLSGRGFAHSFHPVSRRPWFSLCDSASPRGESQPSRHFLWPMREWRGNSDGLSPGRGWLSASSSTFRAARLRLRPRARLRAARLRRQLFMIFGRRWQPGPLASSRDRAFRAARLRLRPRAR